MSGSIGKRPVLGVEMNQMQFPGVAIIQRTRIFWGVIFIMLITYYLLDAMICSLPLVESFPQCRWNWANSYVPFSPPPVMQGILPLGNFLCKLYIAASDSEKWIIILKLSNKGMKYERLTGMSVIHQYHSVNVAIVVKSKFGKGFPHRRSWMDVDW